MRGIFDTTGTVVLFSTKYRLSTLEQRPKLLDQYTTLAEKCWPIFLYYHDASRRYASSLATFGQHQLLLTTHKGHVIAAGNMLPICWDGTQQGLPAGWDTALQQIGEEQKARTPPTALLAISVMVDPEYQGLGISRIMLQAMCKNAARHGFSSIIAPVRPTWKSRYPFVPMEEYITWTRADGEIFDPWIRAHVHIGGKILKVAPRSMVMHGSITEWEAWTGICMPSDGAYAIPGGLDPVNINYENNAGSYEESNVWMVHMTPTEEHSPTLSLIC